MQFFYQYILAGCLSLFCAKQSLGQKDTSLIGGCNPDSSFACFAEEMPVFIGSKEAFVAALINDVKLTDTDEKAQKDVFLTFGFIVTCNGTVTKVHVFNNALKNNKFCYAVVNKLKNTRWSPGTRDGRPANIVNYLVMSLKNGEIQTVHL